MFFLKLCSQFTASFSRARHAAAGSHACRHPKIMAAMHANAMRSDTLTNLPVIAYPLKRLRYSLCLPSLHAFVAGGSGWTGMGLGEELLDGLHRIKQAVRETRGRDEPVLNVEIAGSLLGINRNCP
jgi:hypothetical protein